MHGSVIETAMQPENNATDAFVFCLFYLLKSLDALEWQE
jgi:hypothetical protein